MSKNILRVVEDIKNESSSINDVWRFSTKMLSADTT
jgi:hypothetical protein